MGDCWFWSLILMDGLQLGSADDGWAIVHIPPEQKSPTMNDDDDEKRKQKTK
jgi:hypothetical protein